METGVVEEVRGGVVEARHSVHAVVVDASRAVLASAGDPELACMLRSAAKPLQAMPAVRDGVVSRYGLEDRHVAVACGSHEGTPAHAATVADLVARAGLSVAALRPRGVRVSVFCPGITATSDRPGGQSVTTSGTAIPSFAEFLEGVDSRRNKPATADFASSVLIEGMRKEQFLISSQVGYEEQIVEFAQAGLDPLALIVGKGA